MANFVVWDGGKPVAASDRDEAKRLNKRIIIIDKVLKEMGFKTGYDDYEQHLSTLVKDFTLYMKFIQMVDERVVDEGMNE